MKQRFGAGKGNSPRPRWWRLLVPIVGILGINTLALSMAPVNWNLEYLRDGSASWSLSPECAFKNKDKVSPLFSPECLLVAGDGTPIYLIGDSNAAHHSDALTHAARNLDMSLRGAYSGSCPTVGVNLISIPGVHSFDERDADIRCTPWLGAITSDLASSPPGIIVFSISPTYWDESYMAINSYSAEGESHSGMGLELAMVKTIRGFQEMGHSVVILSPMMWGLVQCSKTIIGFISFEKKCSSNIDEAKQWNLLAFESMRSVAETTKSGWFDMREIQCPGGRCSETIRGVKVYSLGFSHFSAEFGTISAVPLERYLKEFSAQTKSM